MPTAVSRLTSRNKKSLLLTKLATIKNIIVYPFRYEGEAVYPPEPEEGYGNTYKKYVKDGPRPAYRPAAPKYEPAPKYEA